MNLSLATHDDVVALAGELQRRYATATGPDGSRLRRIWAAYEADALVIAREPLSGAIAGYGGIVPQLSASTAVGRVVVMTGEVFEEYRLRDCGKQIVAWCVVREQQAVDTQGVESVVVCEHSDPTGRLRSILSDQGFDLSEFAEISCRVVTLPVAEVPPQVELEPLSDGLVGLLEQHVAVDALAGHGEWSVKQAWADKHRSPPACWLARCVDGELVGYVIGMVFPEDPDDLWIEALHASPSFLADGGQEILLRRAAVASGLTGGTISMGRDANRAVPPGWQISRRWWRSTRRLVPREGGCAGTAGG